MEKAKKAEHEEKKTFTETVTDAVVESKPVEFITDALSSLNASREQMLEHLDSTISEVKPKLRGWFHLASAPLALIGGLVLLVFTPTTTARASIAIFVFASLMLFSISATYHRSNGWVRHKTRDFLQKVDHASISILIAGTNTPFAVLLLEGQERITLLLAVWIATACAVATKFLFNHPPRWINVPIYIGLGWFPIFFIGDLYQGALSYGSAAGLWTFALIVAGGVLYSVGGILFGWRPKWLELKPNVWGYHEWFHLFTILAFFCHYAAVSIIAYSL